MASGLVKHNGETTAAELSMNEYNQGHASGQPIGERVEVKEPRIYNDLPELAGNGSVTTLDVAHFVEQGFLVKRGLVKDMTALSSAVDLLWENVPRNILTRDDPATWLDSPHEKWMEEDVDRIGRLYRGNWKMRSRGSDGLGTQSFLVDRVANCPAVTEVAKALLGSEVEPARRVRGVYAVFPKPPCERWKLGPHGDYMASQLSAMVFADDIPPHCGGFALWPGSHIRLHCCWDNVHGSTITGSNVQDYPKVRDQILMDTTPVEFSGKAGDVVFWHPRLLHSAGVNCSAEEGNPIVRVLIPCDYQRAGLSYYDDLEFGPGPMYQYWVDTRNFREDVRATPSNMWSDWNV